MTERQGIFLVFEGIDGCGKTTQSHRLAARIAATGREVVLTREPGGTPLGQALRRLLLEERLPMAWETEVLLMAADRAQHVAEVVRPALRRGAVVISDRYVFSSLAYQAFGAGRAPEEVLAANGLAVAEIMPDLIIFLSLPPEQRYQRLAAADRIEQRGPAYQQRVFAGFQILAARYDAFAVLDVAGQTEEQVAALVWQLCLERLPALAEPAAE